MNLIIYIFTYNVLLAPSLIAWLSEGRISGRYHYNKFGDKPNSVQPSSWKSLGPQFEAQQDTLDTAGGEGEWPAGSKTTWLSEGKFVGRYDYNKLGETSNSIQPSSWQSLGLQVDAQKDTLDMADGDGEWPAGLKTLKINDDAPIIYKMKGPGDEGAIIYDSGNDYFDGANKQTEPYNEDDDLRVIPLKEQEKEVDLSVIPLKQINDVNIEMIEEHSRAGN